MWSPQHYLLEGRRQQLAETILTRSVDQIEQVLGLDSSRPAVLTLNHLAQRVEVPYDVLRNIVSGKANPYRTFSIRKRSGGRRTISVPEPNLMKVQRWIQAYILVSEKVHPASFAFRKKTSIVDCAGRHTGAQWLLKMDVADFFGSISEIQVYRAFLSFGYQPLVALELARLCTWFTGSELRYQRPEWSVRDMQQGVKDYRAKKLRGLPQGAPTSPAMSNIVMLNIDQKLSRLASRVGLTYTRYSDDLTFSSRDQSFGRSRLLHVAGEVMRALRQVGLFINQSKTVLSSPGSRKVVLGLNVDGARPRLTRKFRDSLRGHVHYLELYGPARHAEARGFDSIWGLRMYLSGLLDYAWMVEEDFAAPLLIRFFGADWPE